MVLKCLLYSNIVKFILWNIITIKNNCFLFEYIKKKVIYSRNGKAEFSAAFTLVKNQSKIFRFATQETFLIIFNVENSCVSQYICWNHDKLFLGLFYECNL